MEDCQRKLNTGCNGAVNVFRQGECVEHSDSDSKQGSVDCSRLSAGLLKKAVHLSY